MATADPDKQQLEAAFATFNRVSAELDASYQVLQARIAGLTEELAEARSQRLQELAEKERLANRLALLMEELPGGVIVVNKCGRIREANHAAIDFMGCALVSKKWQDVLLTTVASERPLDAELILNNGRRLSVNSTHMTDEDEQVILLTDMTRLHELQESVSRDQRLSALGEMAARLAHQIRTPLSSALLYMGHLNHAGIPVAQRNRVTEKVMSSLRHMENLVDTMLNFVRGAPPARDIVEVEQLASELVDAIAPLVSEAGGVFRQDIDTSGEHSLLGDKDALISAILNLVDNAIVVSTGDLVLRLGLAVRGEELVITVADNGGGIAPELCERIFDPFFTTRVKGTGLGLAVVAMTARSHGGKVSVSSKSGNGSVFELTLPVYQQGGGDTEETRYPSRHDVDALSPAGALA